MCGCGEDREESLTTLHAHTQTTPTEFLCMNNTFLRNTIDIWEKAVSQNLQTVPSISDARGETTKTVTQILCVCVGKVCTCMCNVVQALFSASLPTHLREPGDEAMSLILFEIYITHNILTQLYAHV